MMRSQADCLKQHYSVISYFHSGICCKSRLVKDGLHRFDHLSGMIVKQQQEHLDNAVKLGLLGRVSAAAHA